MVKRYTVPEYSVLYAKSDGLLVEYKDYAALEAKVAELEKDAARYRWLRDVGYGKATRILTNMACVADCLIDEAMSREA